MSTEIAKQVPNTVQDSALLLKKITGAVISHIVYARNLFDEKDFIDKTMAGVPIKVIQGLQTPAAKALNKWIVGAFHALQLKYLHSMTLEIRSETGIPLESYSFTYSYKDGDVGCTFSGKETQKISFSDQASNTEAEMRSLIRNVLVATSTLRTLPLTCVASVKLTYTEATPEDFQPEGYAHFDGPAETPPNLLKFSCGKINTSFHTMKVIARMLDPVVPSNDSQSVQCLCGLTDSNSNMLKCDKCQRLQHSACYKVFAENDMSQRAHTCSKCSGQSETSDYAPEECIFRRALILCIKSKSITIRKCMQAFQIDADSAVIIIRRLQREEALQKTTQILSTDKLDFPINTKNHNINFVLKQKYFSCSEAV